MSAKNHHDMRPKAKPSSYNRGKLKNYAHWLRFAVVFATVLCYVFITQADNYALLAKKVSREPVPTATPVYISENSNISIIFQGQPKKLQLKKNIEKGQSIRVPGGSSWAHLQFTRGKPVAPLKPADPLMQIGINKNKNQLSEYNFPCGIKGNSVINWGFQATNGSGCQRIRVQVQKLGKLVKLGIKSEQAKLSQPVQTTSNLLKADTSRNPLQYCSAIADSGKGWGFSSTWNLFSSDDPCQQALQKCRESSAGSKCSITSLGEWSVNDENLTASVECDDNPPLTVTDNGNEIGNQLLALEEKAQATKADICVLDIYNPNEALVSPASSPNGGEYLFQTEQLNDTTLAIDALVGNFTIQFGENPQSEILLQQGERYLLIDNQQNRRETIKINPKEIARSDSIQVFLNPNNWPNDAYIKEKIEKIRAKLLPPINSPPETYPDTASTQPYQSVAINVLSNDRDPDGDPLKVTNITQGSDGSVSISSSGTVNYSPNPGFFGSTDQFTYTISDDKGETATGTVTIDIEQAPNRPPEPKDDIEIEYRDNLLQGVTINVLANDSDPDEDQLKVIEVTQGESGQVKLNSDGTITYTLSLESEPRIKQYTKPAAESIPSSQVIDRFTYRVSDDKGGTATANVTIQQRLRVEP